MSMDSARFLSIKQEADMDFASILDDIGESIRINGFDVKCIPADQSFERDYAMGGFYDAKELTVTVRKSDFPTALKEEMRADFKGNDYRIKSITESIATMDLVLGDLKS